MIFHDSTLREMVESRPQSLNEFSQLSGVGKTKLDRYGEVFLEAIKAYRESPDTVATAELSRLSS